MYTKRPLNPNGEPLRLPEHYSGVTFSRHPPTVIPKEETEERSSEEKIEGKECEEVKSACLPPSEKKEVSPKKHSFLPTLSGREDILLLILALLLLDEEGGDDTLAYILLGLLFLT